MYNLNTLNELEVCNTTCVAVLFSLPKCLNMPNDTSYITTVLWWHLQTVVWITRRNSKPCPTSEISNWMHFTEVMLCQKFLTVGLNVLRTPKTGNMMYVKIRIIKYSEFWFVSSTRKAVMI